VTPQGYPLIARTKDGREWWVIGWEMLPDGGYEVVAIPRLSYGMTTGSISVVDENGARVEQYAAPPGAPRLLPLAEVGGWVGPGDA
jgi:hypothetical protein